MVKLIKVDALRDGMEIALPVKNKLGQVLLGRDIRLDQKYIKILKTWGIEYVSIKAGFEDGSEKLFNEKQTEEAKLKLGKRFYWEPRNSFERELYEIALQNILETELVPIKGGG